jgi:uncharacterized membrane protein YwzB
MFPIDGFNSSFGEIEHMKKPVYLTSSQTKNLDLHKQLDAALKVFATTDNIIPNINTLKGHADFANCDFNLLSAIIEKLKKDGYLAGRYAWEGAIPKDADPSSFMLYVTYEGLLLMEEGGYIVKLKKEKSVSSQLRFIQIVIAVGTTVAAIYYLLEIIGKCK